MGVSDAVVSRPESSLEVLFWFTTASELPLGDGDLELGLSNGMVKEQTV